MTDKPASGTSPTALPSETNTLLADIDKAIGICDDLEHKERYRSSVNPQKYAEVIEALTVAQSAILALVARNKELEKEKLITEGALEICQGELELAIQKQREQNNHAEE